MSGRYNLGSTLGIRPAYGRAISPGGYSDIFIHTWARVIFLGFKFLNFNIFGGFQKNEYFLGYEIFVDIFLGSSQNWTSFRGYFYVFWGFSQGKYTKSGYSMGCKYYKYFIGVLEISDIFWG